MTTLWTNLEIMDFSRKLEYLEPLESLDNLEHLDNLVNIASPKSRK